METKTKYTFQTVVVTPEVRQEFTTLREELNSSDKQLSLAMWNIVMRNPELLKEEVENIKASIQAERSEVREMKAAAKKAPKAAKKAPKAAGKKSPKAAAKKNAKVRKAKAPKVDMSGFEVVYSAADDEECA